MEQKYLDELQRLGFTNVNPSRPVLEMRAYRNVCYPNKFGNSYAVLNMPTCYDPETEERIFRNTMELLRIVYVCFVKGEKYRKEDYPPITSAHEYTFQYEFRSALTEQELVSEFLKMLDTAISKAEELFSEATVERKKDRLAEIMRRLQVIRVFVEAGSKSYEYYEEDYDIFD